jgi:hypothetical protein
MTQILVKQGRSLLVLLAVLAIAVAACGSSSGTQAPGSSATPGSQATMEPSSGGGGGDGGDGGDGLSSGLANNLNNLDSYQFSYKYVAGSMSWDDAMEVSGTVVNKPVKAAQVTVMGMTTIVVGDKAWVGFGGTWVPSQDTTFDNLVDIAGNYGSWFDKDVGKWQLVGEEQKNGVACVHFKGSEELVVNYAAGGVSDFKADLWIAKDGNYPVSGFFSFTVTGNGTTGMSGMTLDITKVNDPANKVEAPV